MKLKRYSITACFLTRIVGIIMSLTSGSCSPAGNKVPQIVSEKSDLQNDNLFKVWLNDTLRALVRANYLADKNISYVVSPDSLQLDVSDTHEFLYDTKHAPKDSTKKYMLELLKEYSELPTAAATIKFTVHTSYYPAVANGSGNEFVEEIQDIAVKSKDTLIEYGYIRGRLHDKYVYVQNKFIDHYEFTWSDDKLSKKQVGNK